MAHNTPINTANETLEEILANSKQYKMPKFQRDYSWEILWDDIQIIVKSGEEYHYMGYLVLQKGDFVYFDPPYMPINATSSFTGYTDKGFDKQMQRKLKALCEHINNIEAYFMLSNSNTDFIINLYTESHYTIHKVTARRSINSKL